MRPFQYFLNLSTSKKKNKLREQHAFHECGHALMAILFENDFTIDKISLLPREQFPECTKTNWEGVLKLSPTEITKADPSFERKENAILIYLGGIVSQTIYKDGHSCFVRKLNKYLKNLDSLNYEGCDVDKRYMEDYISPQCMNRNMKVPDYKKYIFYFTMKYLSNEEVWKAVVSLSQYLLDKNDLTLCTNEIREHLVSIGFYDYLLTNRNDIVEQCRKR